MTEAFPRKPAPRYEPPTPEEIRRAIDDFATHIRSLFSQKCLAPGCGHWPCDRYRWAVRILDRAGLLDVDGRPREQAAPSA